VYLHVYGEAKRACEASIHFFSISGYCESVSDIFWVYIFLFLSCESEYVDVYSELEDPTEDLLSANLDARYCGTVAPNVRIR